MLSVNYFLLVCLFLLWGHTKMCSEFFPEYFLRDCFWCWPENYMWYHGSVTCKIPYSLSSLSGSFMTFCCYCWYLRPYLFWLGAYSYAQRSLLKNLGTLDMVLQIESGLAVYKTCILPTTLSFIFSHYMSHFKPTIHFCS